MTMSRKQYLLAVFGLAVILGLGASIYGRYWSDSAQARKAADRFVAAAVNGDRAAVESLLSWNAEITADDAIALIGNLVQPEVATLVTVEPGDEPRYFVALLGGYRPDGVAVGAQLMVKSEGGRWVVTRTW
ncbi:hypothetical protein J2Z79_000602 [Symbiobacterium terraclitae]|uniref:DUF4878 domain-containing protein n=1 Tax=Symbiobacterium terraclitae TaxID=557451 RepID=A0ABS4JNY1_9FIRM|nr:hypothetical protein [Symbiobacterium terraclitae]MBP2017228.1 hypothetical protein [Symbiobacterium terraclitae]